MNKLILFLLLTTQAHAIDTDKIAHMGTAFALQTITYGLTKQALGFNDDGRVTPDERFVATIISSSISFAITNIKEFSDDQVDNKDILANWIGISAAIGATFVFEF